MFFLLNQILISEKDGGRRKKRSERTGRASDRVALQYLFGPRKTGSIAIMLYCNHQQGREI
jgi:hypothetical protein